MKSKALKTGLKVLIIILICISIPIALLYACGGSINAADKDKHLVFDAAYTIPSDGNTQSVYVFCTLEGDEKENISMAADQARLEFESNNYKDSYSLNKKRNDDEIKKNTLYSGVTDGSHGTIYAGSGDVEKVAFIFSVGKKDLEDTKDATLDWVSYSATIPVNEIQNVDNVDQMIEDLSSK